jgi:hypothetical protein
LFEASYAVINGPPRGENQDWGSNSKLTQPEDKADTVLVGQSEIDDQDIMRAFLGKTLGGLSISRSFHSIPGVGERMRQKALNLEFIFHH